MNRFDEKHNEMLEPLLAHQEDPVDRSNAMGSEKWHAMLRAAGQHLAGQESTPGFLTPIESLTIKTLTKETLGEVDIKGWRGLHQDSKQNCYTGRYLTNPWVLTCDPWDANSRQDPFAAWVFCWCPCWISLCPFTLTASLLGCVIGTGRDIYNFSKQSIVRPLDDSKGIPLGLFSKKPARGPGEQIIQDEDIPNPEI